MHSKSSHHVRPSAADYGVRRRIPVLDNPLCAKCFAKGTGSRLVAFVGGHKRHWNFEPHEFSLPFAAFSA